MQLGQQFESLFHGSAHQLQGDTLKPGVRMGASAGFDYHKHRGQSYEDVVSASSDESKAWEMGAKSGSGRLKVWEVEPHPETRMGVENADHPLFDERNAKTFHGVVDNKEWVAPTFKVKQQLDIKPGNQGTFPQVDWNRHRSAPYDAFDSNHPPHPDPDSQHRRALVEHYRRENPGSDVNDARAARLASKPAPRVEVSGQAELHLGPQFRSTP